MQKHTHTIFLSTLKKKNKDEVLVICARSKEKVRDLNKSQGASGNFNLNQGSVLTQRLVRLK